MYLHATCCALKSLSLQDASPRTPYWRRKNLINPRHKTTEECWERHGHPASIRAGRVGPKLQKSCATIHINHGSVKARQDMKTRSVTTVKMRNRTDTK